MQDIYIYGKEEYSTRNLANKYGKSHMYYQRKLDLLELPESVTLGLQSKEEITEKHCRHICKLSCKH